MVVESSSMETKLGKHEDVEVELELCLSLGGPFKKTDKARQIKCCPDGNSNACAKDAGIDRNGGTSRKKREVKQQRSGKREFKRIRTEATTGVDLGLSIRDLGNGYGSGQYKANSKDVTIGSPIGSTSDVSDPSSSSCQEGGSCELGENSDGTKMVKPPVNNTLTGTEETARSTESPNDAVVVETQECANSIAKEAGKPPKPRPNSKGIRVNGSLLPFAKMPCVTSTGNGPDGKTVNGFLYRYSKSEISIICVCHGTSFSPAEFIVHAGGTNVSHPLRHITVVPPTF